MGSLGAIKDVRLAVCVDFHMTAAAIIQAQLPSCKVSKGYRVALSLIPLVPVGIGLVGVVDRDPIPWNVDMSRCIV